MNGFISWNYINKIRCYIEELMSILKTVQGIEKLQLNSSLNSSLSNSVQTSVEEDLVIDKVSMKKLTGKVEGSVSPPHGGKKRREEKTLPNNPVWKIRDVYSEDMIGLHTEVNEFYEYIKPTQDEAEMRKFVVDSLREVVRQLFPSMKMEMFGSYCTNLYLPTSDIDVVLLGECPCPAQKLFILREGLIKRRIAKEDSIRVLDRAIVPIIKFTHMLVDVKVDISINQQKGLVSVPYIKDFLLRFPTLPKLIFVIKQFLVSRELNEVWLGGLSSYALIAMCISFLQLHENPNARNPNYNLGVLLQEFLLLYGYTFKYERYCIRIKNGGAHIPKTDFQSSFDNGSPYSLLTVEDPLTEGNDLGRGSYAMHSVKEAFYSAYNRLITRQKINKTASTPPPEETMLEMVLNVPEKMHLNRQSCLECWRTLKSSSANELRRAARIMPTSSFHHHHHHHQSAAAATPHHRHHHHHNHHQNHFYHRINPHALSKSKVPNNQTVVVDPHDQASCQTTCRNLKTSTTAATSTTPITPAVITTTTTTTTAICTNNKQLPVDNNATNHKKKLSPPNHRVQAGVASSTAAAAVEKSEAEVTSALPESGDHVIEAARINGSLAPEIVLSSKRNSGEHGALLRDSPPVEEVKNRKFGGGGTRNSTEKIHRRHHSAACAKNRSGGVATTTTTNNNNSSNCMHQAPYHHHISPSPQPPSHVDAAEVATSTATR